MKQLVYLIIFSLVSTFTSCNWIYKEAPNEELLLEKEMNALKWNEVDDYPSTLSCDSLEVADTQFKKKCLYDFLYSYIDIELNNEIEIINSEVKDTLWISLLISKDSSVIARYNLNNIQDVLTKNQLNKILKTKLDSLPKIYPAIKRGAPVNSEIKIPLVLLIQ